MSIIAKRFPILSKPLTGWLIITLTLSALLLVFSFQEPTELPKLIAWYVGTGISGLIIFFSSSLPKLNIPKRALISLGVWSVLLVIVTIFSAHVTNSIFGILPRYISLMFFLSWAFGILILCAIDRIDFVKILKFYAYLAVLMAALGIVQSFGIAYYAGLAVTIRTLAPSFLGNPNFSAMFVAVGMPILLWMAQSKTKWSAYWHWFLLGISIIGIVIFNSRGAFLAVGVSLFLYFVLVLWKRNWKFSLVIALLALVIAGTAGLFYYDTRVNVAAEYSSNQEETIESRLILWDFTSGYIARHPLAGSGLGNFYIAYRSNDNSAMAIHEWFDDAHNVVLELAATSGLPATILFLGIIGYALLLLFRKYRANPTVGLEVPVMGGILAWLAAGSFTPVPISVWIFLGLLIAAAWQFSGEQIDLGESSIIKPAVGLIGAIFTILGILILSSELFLVEGRLALYKDNYYQADKFTKISAEIFPPNSNAQIAYLQSEILLQRYGDINNKLQKFLNQHRLSSGYYQVGSNDYTELYFDTHNEAFRQAAYQEIDRMVASNSNYFAPYQLATQLHLQMGDPQGALKYSEAGLVLNGEDYFQWIMYANIQYQLGNRQATVNALNKAYHYTQDISVRTALQQFKTGASLKDVPFPDISNPNQ